VFIFRCLMFALFGLGLLLRAAGGDPAAFPGRLPFKVYGFADGIPSATIHAMAQDREGFLWLGTENGLYRYDGGGTTHWGSEEGLPSDWVISLAAAPEGGVWVGTMLGLVRLQDNQVQPVTLAGAPTRAAILSLAVDGSGRLWGSGTAPFKQTGPLACEPVPGGPVEIADAVYAGPSSVWFTQGKHVLECRKDGSVRTWGQAEGLGDEVIGAIGQDGAGNLWAAAHRRLYILEAGASQFQDRSAWMAGSVSLVPFPFCDAQGTLWLPTTRGVLMLRKEGATLLDQRHGLPLREVKGGLLDREGNVWMIGSSLVRMQGGQQIHVFQEAEGLPSNLVWSVDRTASGEVLAGTADGLVRLGPRGFTKAPGTEGTAVLSVAADGDDIWFAALDKGLFLLKGGEARPRRMPFPGSPTHCSIVLRDHQGRIWAVATGHGVSCRKPASPDLDLRPADFGLPVIVVVGMAEAPDGVLWAATLQGLFAHREGRWWKVGAPGLRSDALQGVFAAQDGSLWIWYNEPRGATHFRPENGGLRLLGHLGRKEGLSTDLVDGVRDDGRGKLWITSDQGIFLVQDGNIRRFGRGQGLPSEDCASNSLILDPDGSLWSGLADGLVRIGPDAASRALPSPVVQLLSVGWGGVSHAMPVTAPGVVTHRQGTFEFHFAAPSYLDEKALRYQVRMLGLEDEWRDSEVRVARYPALAGGAYRFEARAAYPGGAFGPPAQFVFAVRAPFWRTWWAFAGACLLCGFLVFHYFRLRLLRMARLRASLEAEVSQRTTELRSSNEALNQLNEQNLGLIEELSTTLGEVKTLQGLIPICSYCKKIRDDAGYWGQLEHYIQSRSEATFSHGICPECTEKARADMGLGGDLGTHAGRKAGPRRPGTD